MVVDLFLVPFVLYLNPLADLFVGRSGFDKN